MQKPVRQKKIEDIALEWDKVCFNRQESILDGKDVSFLSVTAPCILNEVQKLSPKRLLDVGCGTGCLTSKMRKYASYCCGIDMSRNSISIARSNYDYSNLDFFEFKLDQYFPDFLFDVCVSNMALICDPDLFGSLEKMYGLLRKKGVLLLMITHPCFWPKYWGFDNEPWFKYEKEIYIEHDFTISLAKSMGKSTYIHRPFGMYISAIRNANFSIEDIREPYPTGITPVGYMYNYPRFLFLKCKKQ